MSNRNDIFTQINNAVLDLQAAQHQTFERPLKALARLLQNEEFTPINAQLMEGLDLDAFLKENDCASGMIGSATIDWPEDPKKSMGYILLLIQKFAAEPKFMTDFGYYYYHSDNKLISGIRFITGQMIIPFIRDYKMFVENK